MKNRLEELRKARGIKQEELATGATIRPSCWLSGSRGILD